MTNDTIAPRRRIHPWVRKAAEIAFVLAIYLGVRAVRQRGLAAGPAPLLAGRDVEGHAVTLAPSSEGPEIVHFWATWCPVCMAEIGTVDVLARQRPILTVASSSGGGAEIQKQLAARGLTVRVVVDEDGALARAWGVHAFPTTFFLDRNRQIRFSETGYTTSLGFRIRAWMARR